MGSAQQQQQQRRPQASRWTGSSYLDAQVAAAVTPTSEDISAYNFGNRILTGRPSFPAATIRLPVRRRRQMQSMELMGSSFLWSALASDCGRNEDAYEEDGRSRSGSWPSCSSDWTYVLALLSRFHRFHELVHNRLPGLVDRIHVGLYAGLHSTCILFLGMGDMGKWGILFGRTLPS